ncbi:MAG: peptidase M16 [Chloroflexi bacterium]|nr:peptidase M16 [Chloroflexota bacterium]
MSSHGFELIKEQFIEELNTNARLLRHVKSGAELLSLENDDENKSFGITFRTPPEDSTGIAHIMEHAVLGGSRKYQVKEPFVELVKGSFKTFLNAMTASDWTTYPVASTNAQDFKNLVDVYLDAVFHPLITPHHLDQEGWHYEIENADDPLIFKGIVFNEMKGAYSSPDNAVYKYSQQTLFPDNVYRFDSGGDPKEIPNLTYEQFRTFHDTYYHPANSCIVFYGDDDPTDRLEMLDGYLQDYDDTDIDASVDLQSPFSEPKQFTFPYSVEPGTDVSKKGYARVNWALPEQKEPEMWMALDVLSYSLMGTAASPLRKALIDSGLGEGISGGGFSSNLRQPTFSAGLKGISLDDADKVEQLILKTLTDLADQGIEKDMVEAAMNTIEFLLRENNTGSFPRGLALMFSSLSTWIYGDDPLTPLMFEAPLTAVKHQLATNPTYLQDMIRRFLLDNTHRVTLVMEPDPEFQKREEVAEKERLTAVKAKLNDAQIQSLIDGTAKIKEIQNTPDDPAELAKIPRLTLADLDKNVKVVPTDISHQYGADILHHDLFTNGIVYLEVGFNAHTLPQELLPYINLFGRSLLSIGTETEDFVKLSQRIGRKTGGIYATTSISDKNGADEASAWLFLRAKSTMDQATDMLTILKDVLLTVNLDNQERFRQMVLESKAGLESGLIPSGHAIINSRLRSNFSEGGWASEQIGGVAYLFFLRKLAAAVETDWPSVLAKLEAVRSHLINRNGMVCNVTLDEDNWFAFAPQLDEFIGSLPNKPAEMVVWDWQETAVSEGLTIPAQVNYVGKGTNLYDLGYHRHGSIFVITNFMHTTYLWEKVRVQGGAYGGFVTFDNKSGVLNYLSYRDPNLTATLQNYDNAPQFVRRGIPDDELVKSIIGSISSMDAYQLPDAKGYSALLRHLTGVTDSYRQQLRDEVLGTTAADFVAFADVLDKVVEDGMVVVLGSADAIATANEERNDFLQVKKVM